jgi:hypothetical protein
MRGRAEMNGSDEMSGSGLENPIVRGLGTIMAPRPLSGELRSVPPDAKLGLEIRMSKPFDLIHQFISRICIWIENF